jgi:putative hemolysin
MAFVELSIVCLLILVNGVLALSELAIASARMPRLRALADQGVSGANRAMALASDPGRFLSTVQIGITLIGIVSGAVSGATLGQRASDQLASLGFSTAVSDTLGFGLVIGGITYLSLIIGELVPKQIALRSPERLACAAAPAMMLLAKVAAPLVWVLDRSGKAILSLLGLGGTRDDVISDAEIHSMIAEAEQAGVIEPQEKSMIAGVMRLGDRPVRSVMVPRADVELIDIDSSPAAVADRVRKTGHSRFVVYKGSPDNIVGVLQVKDLAAAALRRKVGSLKRLVKSAPVIPEGLDALDVVNVLKRSDVHMGLVHDEYGNFEGIVTAADILQAIVGGFREEKRDEEPQVAERDDGSLLIAGWAPVETLQQRLKLVIPDTPDFNTVAGYVLARMGRLPHVGDSFEDRGYSFEVVDLDGKRIDKVLVAKLQPPSRRARG